MERPRWERIKQAFEAALEVEPERRLEYLSRACGGDSGLRREVQSLLEHHDRSSGFPPVFQLLNEEREPAHAGPPMFAAAETLGGRFEIVRFIGRGGMGEVYECQDLELGTRVALKALRSEFAADSAALHRCKKEVHLARRVTHPNVCRLHDVGRHRTAGAGGAAVEHVFITMELIAGTSLAAVLRDDGPLSIHEAAPISRQIAAALDAVHGAGVIHCDLKPSNVLLVPLGAASRREFRAVVTDFGLARAAASGARDGESLAETIALGQAFGTLAYMAPEQLQGSDATPATDIYAFGLILYEMLTGGSPFPASGPLASALLRLGGEPRPPRFYLPHLDPRSEQAILRCLKTDPAARCRTAGEVASALAAHADATTRRLTAPSRSRRRALAAAGLAVACAAGAVLVLALARTRESAGAAPAGAAPALPVPQLLQITPASLPPGDRDASLIIRGAGFTPECRVAWDGRALAARYLAPDRLRVEPPAAALARPGTLWLTARNGPRGPVSNPLFLPISRPAPALFFARRTFPAGPMPYAVAVGDFTGNGRPDLAVVDYSMDDQICVLLNEGRGRFGPPRRFAVGPMPDAIVAGDFTGNGVTDLATANSVNWSDGTMSVLLGDGAGGFHLARTYRSGEGSAAIAAGDLRGSGKLDLVVANAGEGTISIFFNRGDGTFRPPVKYGPFAAPDAVAVGDLRGNGKLDLVVANADANTVSVLMGNGDGTFRPPVQYGTGGSAPSSVVVADFNHDGRPDIAVTNRDSHTVAVLRNLGDGVFARPVVYPVTYFARSLVAGDFYGTGHLDLAAVNGFVGTVSILLGNGDGTFQNAVSFPAGVDASSIAAGDFRGDGRLGLAATDYYAHGGGVTILTQAPAVRMQRAPLDLGRAPVNREVGFPGEVALANTGSDTLRIRHVGFVGRDPGEFRQSNNCGSRLAAGATCIIRVHLLPSRQGEFQARLAVDDNAAGSPQELVVRGTGVMP
jgi:hypothetical protein